MKTFSASNPDQVLIQQRHEKVAKLLSTQRTDIQIKLKKQFQIFISKFEKNSLSPFQLEQCYQTLGCYLKACINLMNVYFPVLSAQEFISLQTQRQLLNRVQDLKNSIFRSFRSLCCRLSLERESVVKKKSGRSPQKISGKKSSNAKTPIENSIVLTQWLLRKFKNPYPSTLQKEQLALQSNLTVPQVNNWFINSRERVIKKYFKKEIKDSSGREKKSLDKQSSSK